MTRVDERISAFRRRHITALETDSCRTRDETVTFCSSCDRALTPILVFDGRMVRSLMQVADDEKEMKMLQKLRRREGRVLRGAVFSGAVWLALMSGVWFYTAKAPAPDHGQATAYSAALAR